MIEDGTPRGQFADELILPSTLAYEITQAEDPEQISFLFTRVTPDLLKKYTSGKYPVLASAKRLIEAAGYSFNIRTDFNLFLDTLRRSEKGPVVGTLTEEVKSGPQKGIKRKNFVRIQDVGLGISVLHANSNLDKFKQKPVEVFGGGEDFTPPNTTVVMDRKKYRHAGGFVNEVGVPFSNLAKVKPMQLIEGSPVSILRYQGRYFIENDPEKIKAFQDYVVERFSALSKTRP